MVPRNGLANRQRSRLRGGSENYSATTSTNDRVSANNNSVKEKRSYVQLIEHEQETLF